jgi:hypothetical protein
MRRIVALLLLIVGIWLLPHRWCGRNAGAWYDGDRPSQTKLAAGVENWIAAELSKQDFSTGSARFDGEWLFGTYMMAGMGFGQMAVEHPQLRQHHVELMETCIAQMKTPDVQAFDQDVWGEGPLATLDGDQHHAAYLGYFNLLLSLHRSLKPQSEFAKLNDDITAALVRRVERSPLMLLETYPDEVYPVDNCAVIASIALYDKATGADHQLLIERWKRTCRSDWIDARTGLLFQAMQKGTQEPADAPRGSGTCLGAYFLSFADSELSDELHEAAKRQLAGTLLGFGVVREYPASVRAGQGDIDSGPLIFGYSISATGFCLSGCRIHGDRDYYRRLFATSYLFGAPLDRGDGRKYVSGGPLGDAMMFAMLTALPAAGAERGAP